MIHTMTTLARSKAVLAAAALTLAAGGSVGAKAAATGNPNPFRWGHHVKQQVSACKQELPPGQHGIGACVSQLAKQRGVQMRDERSHGKRGAQMREQHSHANAHPTGLPTAHPSAHGKSRSNVGAGQHHGPPPSAPDEPGSGRATPPNGRRARP